MARHNEQGVAHASDEAASKAPWTVAARVSCEEISAAARLSGERSGTGAMDELRPAAGGGVGDKFSEISVETED